ncbi:phage baseplate assembly protein V [Streptomyces sp. NPDC005195]|uniref:phage baseplate assembly protein V n=1 Tax=Streptomyces sp. NPDC005195 TaxID=3154561 RepID=UPI0033A2C1CD
MFEPFFDALDESQTSGDPRMSGVAPAIVVENLDLTHAGRVQVRYAWLPGVEPWARVCAPVAGDGSGIWCLPQPGDEVLVGFHNGDVREPYVLGGLWSMVSPPPVSLPTDARFKRVLRSPQGHEFSMDDLLGEVVVRHQQGHSIKLARDGITISVAGGAASVTLDATGTVTLSGKRAVEARGLDITLKAADSMTASGTRAALKAQATCTVQGAMVKIN